MTASCAGPRAAANFGSAGTCTASGKPWHLIALFRRLWPSKTAAELSARTGASERMCKYWLAERYDLSADALAALLRSDEGLAVLESLMTGARPAWWRDFKRRCQLGELRREIEARRKVLERLEAEE